MTPPLQLLHNTLHLLRSIHPAIPASSTSRGAISTTRRCPVPLHRRGLLHGRGIPQIAQQRVHINLRGALRRRWWCLMGGVGWRCRCAWLLRRLERREERVEGCVVEVTDHACEVGCGNRGLGLGRRNSVLGVLLVRIASGWWLLMRWVVVHVGCLVGWLWRGEVS